MQQANWKVYILYFTGSGEYASDEVHEWAIQITIYSKSDDLRPVFKYKLGDI